MGSDALARIKQEGVKQRLCTFLIEASVSVHGGELISRDGRTLGITTSGNFGHTLGKSIAFGYLPIDDAGHDTYEIECFGEPVGAVRSPGVPFDPKRQRIFL
jgi:4-methylaminobutanoate oxidase (formaldehyde-forming)